MRVRACGGRDDTLGAGSYPSAIPTRVDNDKFTGRRHARGGARGGSRSQVGSVGCSRVDPSPSISRLGFQTARSMLSVSALVAALALGLVSFALVCPQNIRNCPLDLVDEIVLFCFKVFSFADRRAPWHVLASTSLGWFL
eukprot:SAG31_NODE_17202_length_679_cov_1.063793_1_plen_139_part_01